MKPFLTWINYFLPRARYPFPGVIPQKERIVNRKARLPISEQKVGTKVILMAAWAALMCLYIYCDIMSLFRPGQIGKMVGGKIGFMDVSQSSLFSASLLMAIPALMILMSAIAPARLCRILNLLAGAAYFLVNIGNLVGETWAYYFLFGLLETGMVVFIFVLSLRWPRSPAAS
jgi:hypothetical protein